VDARLDALAVAGIVVRLVERREAMVDEGDAAEERRRARAQGVEAVERGDRRAQRSLRTDAAAEAQ
jgi:hypothetical protein